LGREHLVLHTQAIGIDQVDSIDVVRVVQILGLHDDKTDWNPTLLLDSVFRTEVSFVRLLYKKKLYILTLNSFPMTFLPQIFSIYTIFA
jgi:hypothetical protein